MHNYQEMKLTKFSLPNTERTIVTCSLQEAQKIMKDLPRESRDKLWSFILKVEGNAVITQYTTEDLWKAKWGALFESFNKYKEALELPVYHRHEVEK